MCKCNGHLSNKNVLSNFLKEFLLREESFNLAADHSRLWDQRPWTTLVQMLLSWFLECIAVLMLQIATVFGQALTRLRYSQSPGRGAKPFKHWCIRMAILKIILFRRGNQWRSRNTGEMRSYFLAPVMNFAAAFCTLCKRRRRSSLTPYNRLLQ